MMCDGCSSGCVRHHSGTSRNRFSSNTGTLSNRRASTSAGSGNPHPGFDRFAEAAESRPGWTHREMATAHLPNVTDPDTLTGLLSELGG